MLVQQPRHMGRPAILNIFFNAGSNRPSYPFIHSSIHPSIHPYIHPFIHPFINSWTLESHLDQDHSSVVLPYLANTQHDCRSRYNMYSRLCGDFDSAFLKVPLNDRSSGPMVLFVPSQCHMTSNWKTSSYGRL
jgi:hypothetical protein